MIFLSETGFEEVYVLDEDYNYNNNKMFKPDIITDYNIILKTKKYNPIIISNLLMSRSPRVAHARILIENFRPKRYKFDGE